MCINIGEIVLHQDWKEIEEIVGSALTRLQRNLGNRPVRTLLAIDYDRLEINPARPRYLLTEMGGWLSVGR